MAIEFGERILLTDETVRVFNRQGQLLGVYNRDQLEYNTILMHYGYNDLLVPQDEAEYEDEDY